MLLLNYTFDNKHWQCYYEVKLDFDYAGISFYMEGHQIDNYIIQCWKSNFLRSSLDRIKTEMAFSEIEFSVHDYSLFIKFLSTFLRNAIYRSNMKQQWCQDPSRVKFGSSAKVQKDKIAVVVGRQQRYAHTWVFITLNSTNIKHKNTENGTGVSPSTVSVTVAPNFQIHNRPSNIHVVKFRY